MISESESEFLYSVLLWNNHLPIRYRHRQSGSTAYRLQARPAPTGPGLQLTAMPRSNLPFKMSRMWSFVGFMGIGYLLLVTVRLILTTCVPVALLSAYSAIWYFVLLSAKSMTWFVLSSGVVAVLWKLWAALAFLAVCDRFGGKKIYAYCFNASLSAPPPTPTWRTG